MIEEIMQEVKRKTPNRSSVLLNADERDVERIRLFETLGGKKLEYVDTLCFLNVNEYVAEYKELKYNLSSIDKMDLELCQQISETYRYVWSESCYVPNGEVVKRLLDNSDGNETLSWVVRKDNKIVAFICL